MFKNPTGWNIYHFGPHFIFQKVHLKDTEFNFIFTPVTLKDLPQRFILIFTPEVFSKKNYHKENNIDLCSILIFRNIYHEIGHFPQGKYFCEVKIIYHQKFDYLGGLFTIPRGLKYLPRRSIFPAGKSTLPPRNIFILRCVFTLLEIIKKDR